MISYVGSGTNLQHSPEKLPFEARDEFLSVTTILHQSVNRFHWTDGNGTWNILQSEFVGSNGSLDIQ